MAGTSGGIEGWADLEQRQALLKNRPRRYQTNNSQMLVVMVITMKLTLTMVMTITLTMMTITQMAAMTTTARLTMVLRVMC